MSVRNTVAVRLRPRTCGLVTREHVLRSDLGVELGDAACLVAPAAVLSRFVEVLEWPAAGVRPHLVLLESELERLSRSQEKRARALANSSVFCNAHFSETHVLRTEGEELEEYAERRVQVAVEWLVSRGSHVRVLLDVREYAAEYHAGDEQLLELVTSLEELRDREELTEAQLEDGMVWKPHLTEEEVQEGLSTGAVLVGRYFSPWIDNKYRVHSNCANRALDGDTVAFVILDEEENAEVVCVLQRERTSFVCSIDEGAVCTPMDRRVPRIRIGSRNLASLTGKRFLVTLDAWHPWNRLPEGHLVRIIGDIGDLSTEMEAILLSNNLQREPFSEALLAELPSTEWKPTSEDRETRRDFTAWRVFSIDPPGSQDIDDALSIEKLDDGQLRLGVHIADVASFVGEGSLIDLEAKFRTATVYLADRRFNMIPELLAEQLISLRGGQERRAMSIVWEMDAETLEIRSEWFGPSLIRSLYEMSYNDAHALLNNCPVERYKGDKLLRWELNELVRVGRKLQKGRGERGAVSLEADAELRFKEGEMLLYEEMEIKEIVAEMMIQANTRVARILRRGVPQAAMLRKHPAPFEHNFEELRTLFHTLGLTLKHGSNEELAQSLDAAPVQAEHILRSAATLAMNEAQYLPAAEASSDSQFAHYGLGLELYTHFTSPIRRYADVLVHRQLLHLAKGASFHDALDPAKLKTQCGHINRMTRAIKKASRESAQLFQCLYFRDKGEPIIVPGIVSGLREDYMDVYLPTYKTRASCEREPGLRLFQHVTVQVGVSDDMRFHIPRLQLKIVEKKHLAVDAVVDIQRNVLQKLGETDDDDEAQGEEEEAGMQRSLAFDIEAFKCAGHQSRMIFESVK